MTFPRLSLLALTLAAPLSAGRPQPADPVRAEALLREGRGHLEARRFELGLDGHHGFALLRSTMDATGGAHLRFQQTYKGVPVLGGEAITHLRNGELQRLTDGLLSGLNLNVRPEIEASEALASAHAHLAPEGAYAHPPTVRLVVAEIGERPRPTLVYHVHQELENGNQETRHEDRLVDARTGRVLESWDTLHRAGSGRSQWYGTVALATAPAGTGFELRDTTRGAGGAFGANVTTNLNNGTGGNGTIFTDADDAWGDGLQYNGTPGTGANAQTAGVDGHRGMAATWDFYEAIFQRTGIDDAGTATYSRMHYGSNYYNAFWSDSCFCMTYGDGAPGGSVGEADLDTCGHEMTHGVTSRTSNLAYRGETGGLNEATSDILGTMVEFWTLGGGGAAIPNQAGSAATNGGKFANYKLFENSWGHAYPSDALRWMHKPSRDGRSPDAWSSSLKRLDVHYSSGVANHFFFLVAHGSQIDALSENEQSPLANGVTAITGIGNDKAARIWYRALTRFMTSSTTYVNTKKPSNTARAATLAACDELIAEGVLQASDKATVALAWKAVNVP